MPDRPREEQLEGELNICIMDTLAEIFKRAGMDFYKIDPMLFSPARITFQNLRTGRTHTFGRVEVDVLKRSFFEGR